jgi:hypothetical protein
MRLVGLALPENELVRFVKPDPAVRRKRHQILILDRVERRVLFQEVGDAVTDG